MSAHTPARVLGPQFAPAWHRPWFRYIEPVPGAEAGNKTPNSEDLGFPKDTPVDDMTDAQQAAYWKNQSKTQQRAREDAEKGKKAYEKFGTVDELQSAVDAAEQARVAALDDNQKAIETARAEGKAEGAAESGGKHLAAAVTGMLIAHTKGAQESFEDASKRVSGAIEFADLTKFIGENGELDADKVQTFAQSIGSAGGDTGTSSADWGARHERDHANRMPPAPGATGSVASMEQAAYEAMTKKTA